MCIEIGTIEIWNMVHFLCQSCKWPFLYFSNVNHVLIRKINILFFFISYEIVSYTAWKCTAITSKNAVHYSSHIHYIFCLFTSNIGRHSKSTAHHWNLAHSTKGFSQHQTKIVLNEYIILLPICNDWHMYTFVLKIV